MKIRHFSHEDQKFEIRIEMDQKAFQPLGNRKQPGRAPEYCDHLEPSNRLKGGGQFHL
jgi:hypothetical protein